MTLNELNKQKEFERESLLNVELPNLIHRVLHLVMHESNNNKEIVNLYIQHIKKITNAECDSALEQIKD